MQRLTMDNFRTIYRILHYLETAMDYDEPDMDRISAKTLGITDNRWIAIMEQLVSYGYIDGVSVKRSADGAVTISECNPRITIDGLEYLAENSLMRKAANMAKGIVEIIK